MKLRKEEIKEIKVISSTHKVEHTGAVFACCCNMVLENRISLYDKEYILKGYVNNFRRHALILSCCDGFFILFKSTFNNCYIILLRAF
jgi:hypothetical protein